MASIFIKILAFVFLIFQPIYADASLDFNASLVGLEAFPEIESSSKKLSQLLNPDSSFRLTSEGVLRDIFKNLP
jgi:hypothetical protein